ncbi:MAG: ABC transporter ATP-binding protein, partial [Planctomycetota bacterium]
MSAPLAPAASAHAVITDPTVVVGGRGLVKRFKRGKKDTVTALRGIDLTVTAGSLTALVGPDGAGKTTLLRLVAGLMRPDEGSLHVLGRDVAVDPQPVQERLGYMPQRFGLYEDLTVQENVDLYADLHGVTPAERRERYPRLMNMTQLGPFTRRLAGRLSGGMKQKLGLACTLVRKPDLLLLDEPTVGVDPLSRRELWEIITALVREQQLTVLMSTSYLDEAERCDHAVLLHGGRVLVHGPPSETAGRAQGRSFSVTPPPGNTARGIQAHLLDRPEVVDAVPEAGRVRVVLTAAAAATLRETAAPTLNGLPAAPLPAGFEDGFMVVLRDDARTEAAAGT